MKGLLKRKSKDEVAKKEEVAEADPDIPGVEVIVSFPVQLVDQTTIIVDDKNVPGCSAVFKSDLMSGSAWEELVASVIDGAEVRVIVERVTVPKPPKPAE